MTNSQNQTFKCFLLLSIICNLLMWTPVCGQILFRVAKQDVSTDEFKRVYAKNNIKNSWSRADVEEYLSLYQTFYLKKLEALSQRIDTLPSLISEYNQYVDQLTRNKFTDRDYAENLTNKLIERSKKDVKVSHIHLKIDPNLPSKDTLPVYEKIQELHRKIKTKEDFERIATEYTQDALSKSNKGSVGFINIFMTFPAFEEAAYTTPLNTHSQVIRTPNGYHIVMPTEYRPERGKVLVQHIFMRDENEKDKNAKKAENRIKDAYQKIISNQISFEQAVEQLSDDVTTKKTNGELPPFGTNEMVKEFEEAAFALSQVGEVSQPFESQYGWHIIKLKKQIPPLNESEKKLMIKQKLERDPRIAKQNEATWQKILEKTEFKEFPEIFDRFNEALPDTFYAKKGWKMTTKEKKTMFELGKSSYSLSDFCDYINANFSGSTARHKNNVLPQLYQSFKERKVLDRASEILKAQDSSYQNTIIEYKDGLMIFELMERELWSKALKDTVALMNYYNEHKDEFLYKQRLQGSIFNTTKKELADQIYTALTKDKKSAVEVSKSLDKKGLKDSYTLLEKTIEKGENPDIDQIDWSQDKVLPVFKGSDNTYTVIKINKILPIGHKPFKEVRGRIANLYQKELEQKWIQNLKNKYPITVNSSELSKIIKE